MLGLVLGGVIAAGAGFGLATWGAREGWPLIVPQSPAIETLQADLATLRAQLADQIAALPDPAQIAALEEQIGAAPDIAPLEERLAALENRPAESAGSEQIAELQAQIGTLATRLAEQQTNTTRIAEEIDRQIRQQLQAATTEAEDMRQTAERRAALLGLETALISGLPVAEAAARATEAGVELPADLVALAEDPVTLPDLQAGLADDLRLALLAARQADMGDTLTERLTTFLQTQTGARPLSEQTGDGVEAVLSRIDAQVRRGEIDAAVETATALPAPAREALAPWLDRAARYTAGHAALTALLAPSASAE